MSPNNHKRIWPSTSNVWSIVRWVDPTGYAASYRFERTANELTTLSARLGNQNVVGRAHQYTKCSSIKEHSDLVECTMLSGGTPVLWKKSKCLRSSCQKCWPTVLVELAKGYDAKTVANTLLSKGNDGCYKELITAGGKYLERSTVQNWKQNIKNRDWRTSCMRLKLNNLRYNIYFPGAGALIEVEHGNSIDKAMAVMRSWIQELGLGRIVLPTILLRSSELSKFSPGRVSVYGRVRAPLLQAAFKADSRSTAPWRSTQCVK